MDVAGSCGVTFAISSDAFSEYVPSLFTVSRVSR